MRPAKLKANQPADRFSLKFLAFPADPLAMNTTAELLQKIEILERELSQARAESRTDPMTGVWNRRRFDEAAEELTEAGQPFAIVLFDMANLKAANTELGHVGADKLLKAAAESIRAVSDRVARIGGDEFAVLLPNTTEPQARQIRTRIEKNFGIHEISDHSATFLAGDVAVWRQNGPRLNDLLRQADFALESRKAHQKAKLGLSASR